jgi:hypothetical protein
MCQRICQRACQHVKGSLDSRVRSDRHWIADSRDVLSIKIRLHTITSIALVQRSAIDTLEAEEIAFGIRSVFGFEHREIVVSWDFVEEIVESSEADESVVERWHFGDVV